VAQQAQASLQLEASLRSLDSQKNDLAAQLEACRQEVEELRDALSRERHAKEMAVSEVLASQGRMELSTTKLAAATQEIDGLSARCQSLVKELQVPPLECCLNYYYCYHHFNYNYHYY
jgi:chromosome segregation ATPase